MLHSEVHHEITRLSEEDCFYIVERYKSDFDYPIHKHSECELNFVENAAGAKRVVGDSEEIIGDLDLVLITGHEVEHAWVNHKNQSDTIHEITIQFSPDFIFGSFVNKFQFGSIREMLERAKRGLKFSNKAIEYIRPLLLSLPNDTQGFYTVINFLSLLYELSIRTDSETLSTSTKATIKDSKASASQRLLLISNYVKQNYKNNISVATMAKMVDMSEVAFSRFFYSHTLMSFTNYLIDVRISKAVHQLIDSTQSISEISFNCGFNNLSNFNRIFKKRKGCTPKEFRTNYHKKKIII